MRFKITEKKRARILKRYVLVVAMIVLSLFATASCGGSQPASSPDTSEASTTSHEEELSVIGVAPDFELTNQDGVKIMLTELRGKVVLMTFFYASCPDDVCLMQNLDLMAVYRGLSEASRQDLALISISFDPEVDTPQVLMEYVQARGFDIPGWYFLTGSQREITRVTEEYGVAYELIPAEEETHADGTIHRHSRAFRHMSQVIIIDQDGMIRSQYLGIQIGEQLLPRENMLEDVRALLHSS